MRTKLNKILDQLQIVIINAEMEDSKKIVKDAALEAWKLTKEIGDSIPPSFKDKLGEFLKANGCDVLECDACDQNVNRAGCTHPSNPGNLI